MVWHDAAKRNHWIPIQPYLVNRHPVHFAHLVELVDANNTTVRKNHGSRLQPPFTGLLLRRCKSMHMVFDYEFRVRVDIMYQVSRYHVLSTH